MRHQAIAQTRLLRDFGMLCLFALTFVVISSSPALAGGAGSQVGTILCAIYTAIKTDVGKGIATLGVVSLGVSALVGKVSWGMAIMVAVGIAVMFGAGTLVSSVGAGVSGCP